MPLAPHLTCSCGSMPSMLWSGMAGMGTENCLKLNIRFAGIGGGPGGGWPKSNGSGGGLGMGCRYPHPSS